MVVRNQIYENLHLLGGSSEIPKSPDEAILEKIVNPTPGINYLIRFTCPEFTSICPKTEQPDFAILVIDYVPKNFIVESKSLKLFLHSYRNHGAFHEECTITIATRLINEIEPLWLRIGGYWYPRGGIPIDIFYQSGILPQDVWVPDHGIKPYRGRE